MPRRPRPVSRKPPTKAVGQQKPTTQNKLKFQAAPPVQEDDEEVDQGSEDGESSSGEENVYSDEEDADADAPRVVQWVDDEELDARLEQDNSEEPSEDEQESRPGPSRIKRLQADLSSLPLGTLRKAQQALARSKAYHGSSDKEEENDSEPAGEDDADDSAPEEETSSHIKSQEREKREIQKRSNKHAPMETTSKRPVPRKKANIEVQKPIPRDPRFLHVAGEFNANRFRNQYGFLAEMHTSELSTLRENLKRARKMLISSPRDQREAREQEVQRLERAVKRAESTVHKDKREQVEASALSRVRKEEKEKRKQGKGAWFMKDAEKKELLTRAKFEALAEHGGRGAVRKAIEKKQKKVNQKEKKKRPFAAGQDGGRRQNHSGPNKRQRLS